VPARRLSARWLLPMDGPPLERGAVLIGAGGRIAAVGPDRAVPRPPGVVSEEFADALLLPGLINTHTHLELTSMGELAEPEFARWIRAVRTRKAERTADEALRSARAGLAACHAAGVTTVADTGDSGAVIRALAEGGASGIVYHEVFGPHPDQAAESLSGLRREVAELGRFVGGRVRLGVSPHAPYSVSGELYRRTARWASEAELPMAVHLAESAAESRLLGEGAGPFAAAWTGRGIPLPDPLGCTPVEWLDRHEVLGPSTLCIHLVRAGAKDIATMAARGSAVAHCPRSNRAHGHGDAPLVALLEAGIRVGVGTDSEMSVVPDLLAEARAATGIAGLGAEAALRLCTIEAARALDLDAEIGSLTPGKWGDCVVIRPAPVSAIVPPAERALASGLGDVVLTILGGRDVHRAGGAA
jgi:cytosine/adenosine deaminase-related metal-dependent hydrolase